MPEGEELPWHRLSIGRFHNKRAQAAVLELPGVQALLFDYAKQVKEFGTSNSYRIHSPRTCTIEPRDIDSHTAMGISYFGAKCYAYAPLEQRGNDRRVSTWMQGVAALFEKDCAQGAMLPVDDAVRCFQSLEGSAGIQVYLKGSDGRETKVFLQFDAAMLARFQASSRSFAHHVKQSRGSLSLGRCLRVRAVLGANSLATVLAMKAAGTITLFDPRGVAVDWYATCAGEGQKNQRGLALRAIEFSTYGRVLKLELASNKQKGSAKMNPVNGLLSSLGVQLSVEIGSAELSVTELLELVPGTGLEFRLPAEGRVLLRAGEEAVAEARLVEDGERLLLQITKVLDDSALVEATNHE